MTQTIILAERLKRQGLTALAETPEDYQTLFQQLQPVSPIAATYPGNPPNLVHRSIFDDTSLTEALRAERQIVKGRYQGGNVGYVLAEELELYANAFRRRFGKQEILQYLLVDGVFQGVVLGHWRIGPHDVEDILLLLPDEEITRRRENILQAVAEIYHPPHSRILRYAGEAISTVNE